MLLAKCIGPELYTYPSLTENIFNLEVSIILFAMQDLS